MTIGIPTFIKVVQDNRQKLNLVNEKLVIESAKECIYQGECFENKIYLEELYDKGYLKEDIVDPASKIIYSRKSYVIIEKENATFYPVN